MWILSTEMSKLAIYFDIIVVIIKIVCTMGWTKL